MFYYVNYYVRASADYCSLNVSSWQPWIYTESCCWTLGVACLHHRFNDRFWDPRGRQCNHHYYGTKEQRESTVCKQCNRHLANSHLYKRQDGPISEYWAFRFLYLYIWLGIPESVWSQGRWVTAAATFDYFSWFSECHASHAPTSHSLWYVSQSQGSIGLSMKAAMMCRRVLRSNE